MNKNQEQTKQTPQDPKKAKNQDGDRQAQRGREEVRPPRPDEKRDTGNEQRPR